MDTARYDGAIDPSNLTVRFEAALHALDLEIAELANAAFLAGGPERERLVAQARSFNAVRDILDPDDAEAITRARAIAGARREARRGGGIGQDSSRDGKGDSLDTAPSTDIRPVASASQGVHAPRAIDTPVILADREGRNRFHQEISPVILPDLRRVDLPRFHFVAGQPGAGKSVAKRRVLRAIDAATGPGTVIDLDLDRLRAFHPDFAHLALEDPLNVGERTNETSWRWKMMLCEQARDAGVHVVDEGTIRTPKTVADQARYFREAGYTAGLHVLATNPLISRARMVERFIQGVEDTGCGRLVPRDLHDRTCEELDEAVISLIEGRNFDAIHVDNARGDRLVNVEADDEAAVESVIVGLMVGRTLGEGDLAALISSVRVIRQRAVAVEAAEVFAELDALASDIAEIAADPRE